MVSKRWIRRNRHVNPDLVKAIKQHQRWPSIKIVRKHPITKQYLTIDLRQLQVKSYIEFLRQCEREYMFLELLDNGYFELQTLDEELVKTVKELFKDNANN